MGCGVQSLKHISLLAILTSCCLFSSTAVANNATYTIFGLGTGSLGGTSFSSTPFSIVAEADTDGIGTLPGIYSVLNTQTELFVDGFSSAEFTSGIRTTSNQSFSRAGFGDFNPQGSFSILFVDNSLFETYALDSSIGPVAGPSARLNGVSRPTPTTAGDFYLTSVENATFTATVVPEPNGTLFVMMSLGCIRIFSRHKEM